VTAEVFVAPDADGSPAVWHRVNGNAPTHALSIRSLPAASRGTVWKRITDGLPNEPAVTGPAIEARALRQTAGLTLAEVAVKMECSTSILSRYENAVTRLRPRDLAEMLEIYGVPAERRTELLNRARCLRGLSERTAEEDS
jgi:Helix-turn-helix domain